MFNMEVKDQCLRISESKEQSQEAYLAPPTRMEKPSDIVVEGSVENEGGHHDYDANSRIGYSAFTMFPNVQTETNKRALGQANRYMNANARKQSEKDTGGTRGMKTRKSSADGRDCDLRSPVTRPIDEDAKIAESTAHTLMDISKGAVPSVPSEQPTEIYLSQFEENDLEHLSTVKPIEPVRKVTSTYGDDYCHEPPCENFTQGFASKARRDSRIPSRHNCTMICEVCPRVVEGVGALKDHIMFTHFCEHDSLTIACRTCNRSGLDPEKFFDHIEGCVFQGKETRAAEDHEMPERLLHAEHPGLLAIGT